ncbi:unnamed protein product [Acanthoscelides obtectus]|uniref:Uncharacterized protein n=1 Tax=Acanthoscelides obtectus TaxID=200917 RepID=A0A9P0VTA9_ACAOB|nr:unnamed protein product [Acanthoscelides obtectus]CAH2016733.1 unnamed protein product [Acanthoscelides obtectus]CAH2016770.1 unnamed protein product [Acanthoscelides obtectus]CAH2017431.1 unnamed protein product [Acanthoscelides obtectus]CAH2017614.1 unnamed protein product [Acanthoscelides obtectus]
MESTADIRMIVQVVRPHLPKTSYVIFGTICRYGVREVSAQGGKDFVTVTYHLKAHIETEVFEFVGATPSHQTRQR